MTLLTSKKNIEQYFMDNYTETAIHWAGMKFDIKAYSEWVHIEYIANYVADSGLDNTSYSQEAYLKFSVIAKNPFRCTDIADTIIALFKGKNLSGMFAGKVNITGQDYIGEIDKTAMDFDIYLTTY